MSGNEPITREWLLDLPKSKDEVLAIVVSLSPEDSISIRESFTRKQGWLVRYCYLGDEVWIRKEFRTRSDIRKMIESLT